MRQTNDMIHSSDMSMKELIAAPTGTDAMFELKHKLQVRLHYLFIAEHTPNMNPEDVDKVRAQVEAVEQEIADKIAEDAKPSRKKRPSKTITKKGQ
jgi:hypothetical protein